MEICHLGELPYHINYKRVSQIKDADSSGITISRHIGLTGCGKKTSRPTQKETPVSCKVINPVLRKGHHQDVAHCSATAEEADPVTELYSIASSRKAGPMPPVQKLPWRDMTAIIMNPSL